MVNLWKNMAIQLKFNRFSKWMGWPSGSRKQVPAQRASPKKNPPKKRVVCWGFWDRGISQRIRRISISRIFSEIRLTSYGKYPHCLQGLIHFQVGFLPSAVLKLVSQRVGSTTNQKKSPASRDSQSTHRSC